MGANTTYTQQVSNSDANKIGYAINQAMLNVNTIMPCEIISANDDGTYDVLPLLNYLDSQGNPYQYPVISELPTMVVQGSGAGVIITYTARDGDTPGDTVAVGFCQRDISIVKQNWTNANPASFRKFSLGDGIILGLLTNTPATIFVKITPDGITMTAPSLPINLNCQTCTVAATDSIVLGTGATEAIILQNVALTMNIAGVQGGGGVTGVTATITNGGSSKASAAK